MKRSLWVRISVVIVVVMVMQLVLAGNVAAKSPTNQPAAGGGRWHCVRWGETLYSIGRRYGVSYWAIARANGICNPNRIYAGTWLYIPCSPCPPRPGYCPPRPCPAPRPRCYIVRCGDTLTRIACRFGTSVWAICRANNIWNPNYIYVGQRLVIPDC
jgi:LysM repeat protein